MKKTVVIGLLGTVLDRAKQETRWNKWRPTVSIFQHDDFLVDRFELLREKREDALSRQLSEDIHQVSPSTRVTVHDTAFKDPWDFEEVYSVLHDFASHYPFDTDKEDYYLHITTGTHVAQICLFLLAEAKYFPAKLLQTGPGGQGEKSLRVIDLDLSQYDHLAARFRQEKGESLDFLKSGIPTRNAAFNRLIEEIERVAIASRSPMLLQGPTGSGKTQLARRIYELKRKRHQVAGELVEVNCATLRGDTASSALFGHVKGAFTGAERERAGLLKKADNGILFLDEIGELGPDQQAMLLRALEDKAFLPMGSDQLVRSDFQLIAGTHRDLRADVVQGRFREDLLARIDLWTFQLPGLAQRREDIAPNLDYEVEEASLRLNARVTFSREAVDCYLAFAMHEAGWNANFRDLNASVTRMATLAQGGRITEEGVSAEIERLRRSWSGIAQDKAHPLCEKVLGPGAAADLDRFERVPLEDVLSVCAHARSLSEAGRVLFAASRLRRKSTNDTDRLKKYLAGYGLEWAQVQERLRG